MEHHTQILSAADAAQLVSSRQLSHVQVGFHDLEGTLRGKYLSREKFLTALEAGFGLCDIVSRTPSHADAHIKIIPDTCRDLSFVDGGLLFLCELDESTGTICARSLLRRTLERARGLGIEVVVGFEYEFVVFSEQAWTVRDKRFRDLRPKTPGPLGYSVLRSTTDASWYRDLLTWCEALDCGVEGLHTEGGPGVVEASLSRSPALAAADRAAIFKTFAKVFAARRDELACFMARWSSAWPGCGGHIHMSLAGGPDATGVRHGLTGRMRSFVAGIIALLPELLAMSAPTVNSYRRLLAGSWAPTSASWGIDNRTCAVRVIPGPGGSRIEYRVPGADANPYLTLAAAVASGIWGIERGLDLDEPVTGTAYTTNVPPERRFATTLEGAAERLVASAAARELFGSSFVDLFSSSRLREAELSRTAVSEWELERYFETV